MIRSKEFSRGELISMLEVIETAGACGSAEELKALLLRTKDLLGADFAISGACALPDTASTRIVLALNGNYPQEFVNTYLTEHFHKTDPVVRYLSRFSFTQTWGEIFRASADASSTRAINTAGDFGLKYGVSTGVYMPRDETLNIFSFAGPRDLFGERQKKILEALSLHLNKAMTRAVPGACPGRGAAWLMRQDLD
jgi:hypothetical protein